MISAPTVVEGLRGVYAVEQADDGEAGLLGVGDGLNDGREIAG